MELCVDTRFLSVLKEKKHSLVILSWKQATEHMNEGEFYVSINHFLQSILFKPQRIVIDVELMHFVWDQRHGHWLFDLFYGYCPKNIGIVPAHDLFVQIAIEDIIQKYFKGRSEILCDQFEARKWVLNQPISSLSNKFTLN
ncbi:hypothetical protein V6R21_16395 [Limibacter armeniacum]|uniref:hypothetical protein n=1 Tax=Limibacter armeniacum TaxID=466084 RepID=UPI002FE60B2D